MNSFLNKYFGFSLPASKMVVAKCFKLIWNHSGIISGTCLSPFQGVYYLYRGHNEQCYWIFWTLLNEYFFEWIFWILFWIEFWIESYLGSIQWKNEFSKRIGQGYHHCQHMFQDHQNWNGYVTSPHSWTRLYSDKRERGCQLVGNGKKLATKGCWLRRGTLSHDGAPTFLSNPLLYG